MPEKEKEKRWISVPEVAAYLGVHVCTARRMVANGSIPACRLKGRKRRAIIRVDKVDLDRVLEASKGPEKKKA
jgi:excisionase family DNA binding protein